MSSSFALSGYYIVAYVTSTHINILKKNCIEISRGFHRTHELVSINGNKYILINQRNIK